MNLFILSITLLFLTNKWIRFKTTEEKNKTEFMNYKK